MKFADRQIYRSSLMHFHFAKYRHKKILNCINVTVPWLILQSCLYKRIKMLKFPVYSQGESRFAKVARTLGFSQTDCSELTGRYHHRYVVPGKHVSTGSRKKKPHLPLPRFATLFVFGAIGDISQRILLKRLMLISPVTCTFTEDWVHSGFHHSNTFYILISYEFSSLFNLNINFVKTMYNHLKNKDTALHRIISLILDSGF